MRIAFASAALLALAAAAPARAADYVQAPGSTLTFATEYQGDVISGRFPAFTTRLRFDPAKLDEARLDVSIPLAATTTGEAERDEAITGADLFNVARFPQARYVATRFRALGGNRYAADGTLTLRGITRPVTLSFTWTPGPRPVLAGRATVRRLAFGVGAGSDWKDTEVIPDAVAVATRVVFTPTR